MGWGQGKWELLFVGTEVQFGMGKKIQRWMALTDAQQGVYS